MDPVVIALAGKAVAILRPFVVKTAEEFVTTVGQAGYDRTRRLLERLRARWAGDAAGAVVLDGFEKEPERFEPALEAVLQQSLAGDPELREAVAGDVEALGAVITVFQRLGEAQDVTGLDAQEVAGGTVSVTQEIEKGTGITGARIGRIG